MGLEESNGTSEAENGLKRVHGTELVGDELNPSLSGLNLSDHVTELVANYTVVDEADAEGLASVSMLDGLFNANASKSKSLNSDTPALGVEVGDNILETLILLSDQVGAGYRDILEGDVGGSRGPQTRAVHLTDLDTRALLLDQEERDSLGAIATGADSDGEVVSENTISDPLLLTVHNVVGAIRGLTSLALELGNVRTSVGLSDSETDDLLTSEAILGNLILKY
jgi:hypothetical protein